MAAGTVPITREFLREHYKKFPFPPFTPEFAAAEAKISTWVVQQNLSSERIEPPRRSDENFWKQREMCELTELHLVTRFGKDGPTAQEARANIKAAYDALANFQTTTAQEVQRMVEGFLPQDFRVTMMRYARDRKEKANTAEVDAFVASGGTVEGKYKLLLAQQMQRRESLVQMANATGMWRALITWIGGVPPTLLDFMKQLNDPEGPMEEYRAAYGPPLYQLTRLALDLQIFAKQVRDKKDSDCATELSLLTEVSAQYRAAVEKLSLFLIDVLKKSPFFIVDPAALTHGDQPKEVWVAKWSAYDLPINVQKADTVRWEFTTKNNADIGFGVNFIPSGGAKQEVQTSKRVNSHLEKISGQYLAPADGVVELKWDNTYSYMTSKQLAYKAELLPSEATLSPPPSPAIPKQ